MWSLENKLWNPKKKKPCTTLEKTEKKSRRNQEKKSKQRKPLQEESSIGGKDASLFLFRALGKILHCKRKWDLVWVQEQATPLFNCFFVLLVRFDFSVLVWLDS